MQRLAGEEDVVYVAIYDAHGREVIRTSSRPSGRPPPSPPAGFLSDALTQAQKDAEHPAGQMHGLLDEVAARRSWKYENEAFNCTDLYSAIVLPDRGGPGTARQTSRAC